MGRYKKGPLPARLVDTTLVIVRDGAVPLGVATAEELRQFMKKYPSLRREVSWNIPGDRIQEKPLTIEEMRYISRGIWHGASSRGPGYGRLVRAAADYTGETEAWEHYIPGFVGLPGPSGSFGGKFRHRIREVYGARLMEEEPRSS